MLPTTRNGSIGVVQALGCSARTRGIIRSAQARRSAERLVRVAVMGVMVPREYGERKALMGIWGDPRPRAKRASTQRGWRRTEEAEAPHPLLTLITCFDFPP